MADEKKVKKLTKKNGEPRKPPAPSVPAKDFVMAWQAATSLAEAKSKLGGGASSRAARMRKVGVKLKEFSGGGRPLDVAALNALIAPVAGTSAA